MKCLITAGFPMLYYAYDFEIKEGMTICSSNAICIYVCYALDKGADDGEEKLCKMSGFV